MGDRTRPGLSPGVWKLRPRKGGDLSKVTGHLPPIPMLFRTCSSEPNPVGASYGGWWVLWELQAGVTPWRPVTFLCPC